MRPFEAALSLPPPPIPFTQERPMSGHLKTFFYVTLILDGEAGLRKVQLAQSLVKSSMEMFQTGLGCLVGQRRIVG